MTKTPDLSKLVGAKLVRVADLPMGQDVKESVIKALEQAPAPNVRLLKGSDGFFEMRRRNWLSRLVGAKPVRLLSDYGDDIRVFREGGYYRFTCRTPLTRIFCRCVAGIRRLFCGGAR